MLFSLDMTLEIKSWMKVINLSRNSVLLRSEDYSINK